MLRDRWHREQRTMSKEGFGELLEESVLMLSSLRVAVGFGWILLPLAACV